MQGESFIALHFYLVNFPPQSGQYLYPLVFLRVWNFVQSSTALAFGFTTAPQSGQCLNGAGFML